ncbi:hypothetical protein C8R44DRAFT_775178 [Mycena epipterygia]|nr:hypothetical protein C8R44DRAFT_775178 [Mycena epipterygia]
MCIQLHSILLLLSVTDMHLYPGLCAHLRKLGVPCARFTHAPPKVPATSAPHSSSALAKAVRLSPALYTHSPLQRLTHTAGYAYLLRHIWCRRKGCQRQHRGADVRRDSRQPDDAQAGARHALVPDGALLCGAWAPVSGARLSPAR